MNKLNEDYTAGILAGIPIFCINRFYKTDTGMAHLKIQYRFSFPNNYGASVIEFNNRDFSGGEQYELAVLDHNNTLVYDTDITTDVERGDAMYMHELLCRIEKLNPRL